MPIDNNKGPSRRLVLAGLSAGFATPAIAQSAWPTRPVTVIVPQAAGGTNDIVGRLLSEKLSDILGQRFVVENRVGAGGNIGQQAAARAAPDGYTIMITTSASHVINPALFANPGFDAVADYEPISLLATLPNVVVVHPSFPARTMAELIAMAKARPGELTYGSAGNGTLNHLVGEMLKWRAGLDIRHIPYRGVAAMLNDMIGGHLQLGFANLPSCIAQLQANQVRALAVSSLARAPLIPDVPAISETIPGFDAELWAAIFAAKATPKPILDRLGEATARAMAMPDMKGRFDAAGATIATSTPDALRAKVAADLRSWAEIVRVSGARIE